MLTIPQVVTKEIKRVPVMAYGYSKESIYFNKIRIKMIPIPLCVQIVTIVATAVAGKKLLED